ncbi:DUF2987 domain-containing protein [Photobacterium sanctipauli]|uniref:DUF2987 domain-containing protein n=1 Tax=Photobacterium sanctipauli TaxID=1342794 RepID=UPI00055BE52C|nr:DUF2987 domain-containing protein [Photobacterium sanctipauli]
MKLTHWLIAGLLASSPLHAKQDAVESATQNIEIRYSTLFSKLKQNTKEGHEDVKIALFLLDQRDGSVCKIHRGSMRKDAHFEELVIPDNNEMSVPLDNNLRQANPDVTFVIDDGITCDVSMQVIAKQAFDNAIQQQDVANLIPQMNQMMSDLGGMFSSWFMPDVAGVVVHFDEPMNNPVKFANGQLAESNGNSVILPLASLADGETVSFSQPIVKVTPWIPQA